MFKRYDMDYESYFTPISAIQFVEYNQNWSTCYGTDSAERTYKMAARRNGGKPMMLAKFIDHYYAWAQR